MKHQHEILKTNVMTSIEEIKTKEKATHLLIKEYIENYVGHGTISSIDSNYCVFGMYGMTFYLYIWSELTDIKPSGCPTTMPASKEEVIKIFDSMAQAKKCAVQALMAFKYIIGA